MHLVLLKKEYTTHNTCIKYNIIYSILQMFLILHKFIQLIIMFDYIILLVNIIKNKIVDLNKHKENIKHTINYTIRHKENLI